MPDHYNLPFFSRTINNYMKLLISLIDNRWVYLVVPVIAWCSLAIIFPESPDETSRLHTAQQMIATGDISTFWPPFFVWVYFTLSWSEDAILLARLFGIALCVPALWLLANLAIHRTYIERLTLLAVYPYIGIAAALASNQTPTIAFLPLAIWAFQYGRLYMASSWFALAALANPVLFPALAIGAGVLMALRSTILHKTLFVLALSYVMITPYVAAIYFINGTFVPQISSNGGRNLWQGNNPHPQSIDGYTIRAEERSSWGIKKNATNSEAAWQYAINNPAHFLNNVGKKLVGFWLPSTNFKSPLFQKYAATPVFWYILCSQLAIMYLLLLRRKGRGNCLQIACVLFIGAWVIYTVFYPRIRFRLPFDFIVVSAIMMVRRDSEAELNYIGKDHDRGHSNS